MDGADYKAALERELEGAKRDKDDQHVAEVEAELERIGANQPAAEPVEEPVGDESPADPPTGEDAGGVPETTAASAPLETADPPGVA